MKRFFKNRTTPRQLTLIAGVVVIGIVLALVILQQGKPEMGQGEQEAMGHAGHEQGAQVAEIPKGPHGGKLFTQDGYALEVTIFEQGVPPQFRLYTYQDSKPLDPANSSITMQLERLGRTPQAFTFTPEADYAKGDAVVEEPHSFKVNIQSSHDGKRYSFAYEQVEARVEMTDKQLAVNAIEVLTAAPARIKSTLRLIGEIKLNADKSVQVVPRLNGIVESVSVNAGEKVRKGQLLAVISSQAIADQRSALMATQKRVELARVTFAREKKLWEEKISAEQDYLQARQDMQEAEINLQTARQKLQSMGASLGSGSNLTRFEIKSPIDGVITNKQIAAGQVMKGDESIFVVADLSSVWVEMTIYAKDINTVKIGQKVTIKASAFDAESVGSVAYVGALVGEQSRTAMARVVLPNANRLWLPGLPVNIELTADEVEVPLAVSVEGIQTLRDWKVVFGRYGDKFEARPIETGRSDDRHIEVLHGLHLGEKYAAMNSFLVKADLGKAGASHDH
ncbi:MAG: efflux RND transporter periplasmic adaptor subunit [Methylophilaceae bacterium]